MMKTHQDLSLTFLTSSALGLWSNTKEPVSRPYEGVTKIASEKDLIRKSRQKNHVRKMLTAW